MLILSILGECHLNTSITHIVNEMIIFIHLFAFSLIKEEINRPKYSKLLQHPFIQRGERSHTDVATYVVDVLETMEQHGITPFTTNQPAENWFD